MLPYTEFIYHVNIWRAHFNKWQRQRVFMNKSYLRKLIRGVLKNIHHGLYTLFQTQNPFRKSIFELFFGYTIYTLVESLSDGTTGFQPASAKAARICNTDFLLVTIKKPVHSYKIASKMRDRYREKSLSRDNSLRDKDNYIKLTYVTCDIMGVLI
jgi:hypothetical protein